MTAKPAKAGAERKKIGLLVALVLTAAVIYFWPSSVADETSGKTAASHAPLERAFTGRQMLDLDALSARSGSAPAVSKAAPREFKPSMKLNPAAPIDTERFDPTLRTDVLSKLAEVRGTSAKRSLFDFYTPPQPAAEKLPEPVAPVLTAAVTAPAPRPPIQLHFYGHEVADGGGLRRVFCELNDQVMIPAEGAVLQRRYRIRRILPASVVVEDLESHDEQTLPIEKTAKADQTR